MCAFEVSGFQFEGDCLKGVLEEDIFYNYGCSGKLICVRWRCILTTGHITSDFLRNRGLIIMMFFPREETGKT